MLSRLEHDLLGHAWATLTGQAPSNAVALEVAGAPGALPSAFPVEQIAVTCVGAALLAAQALRHSGNGVAPAVQLDRGHVAAAVRSERYFRRGGTSAGAGFAPWSRFWRTADGWVRTHANYPWHRRALVGALGLPDDIDDADAIGSVLRAMAAEEVEAIVVEAGGVAAAVRSVAGWQAHPQGRAVAAEPLIGHELAGPAAPRRRSSSPGGAAGVRVLDLTRVIAGPVCTRFLGALGADVVRLDPPDHLDMAPGVVADPLLGKRSCFLALGESDGRATLEELLAGAEVVVCGYRPGALDRFGLTPHALAEDHPGLVVVYLDAWGHSGPWAGRRGFDSVVQAPTGIALGESGDGKEPGALPCQLLDHGTGYLAAAAVLDGVRRQRAEGGTHVRRLSLARTAAWLTSAPPPAEATTAARSDSRSEPDASRWLVELDSTAGPITAVAPPGALDGQGLRWIGPVSGYGEDRPGWSS